MPHPDIAVSVRGLSKSYTIARGVEKHVTLAESLLAKARRPFARPATETFWALQDLRFDIKRGDVVGIIGRNGAGKSTLLKILSRITEPTSGVVNLYGRVGSLLEVGTGFHPELTGRENVFLNGAILGMSKAEIRKQFDAIVEFAGVEKFLETPVKRYSSGMYVRLAFSVAAHLRTEILIVDEVLAVGDANFQQRCLGKIGDLASDGRTILLVSHNMTAISQFCSRCLVLTAGHIVADADPLLAVRRYFELAQAGIAKHHWKNSGNEFLNDYFQPLDVKVCDLRDLPTSTLDRHDGGYIQIEGDVRTFDAAVQVGYQLSDSSGAVLYVTNCTDQKNDETLGLPCGRLVFRAELPLQVLNNGEYRLQLMVSLYHRQWFSQPGVNAPEVHFTLVGKFSGSPYWVERRPGCVAPMVGWTLSGGSVNK